MPPVLVNDNCIASVVVNFTLKQCVKGKWHFFKIKLVWIFNWSQPSQSEPYVLFPYFRWDIAVTTCICSLQVIENRNWYVVVLEFTATIRQLISVSVDPILNNSSWSPIMHTSKQFLKGIPITLKESKMFSNWRCPYLDRYVFIITLYLACESWFWGHILNKRHSATMLQYIVGKSI